MRKIEPAKNYDVESFARAMNPDFAPRLKKLFDPETEAAVRAQRTGTVFYLKFNFQGPVVQSVRSLTSSLRIISLPVLADSIYNILI